MNVVRSPDDLARRPRAVAIGTFDGVHVGHRAVVGAAVEAGLTATIVTFDPHPRGVLGRPVELLATLERRLELFDACGVDDVLVVDFTPDVAELSPERFAEEHLLAIGAEVVVAGAGFKFGRDRAGDLQLLAALGLDVRPVALVEGISSTGIRQLIAAGDVVAAARQLGRAPEVEGRVVGGDHRGRALGFPTANVDVPANLLIPPDGVYAGAVGGARAAVSIGTNPHYGGTERRIEAFLLDWSGDLYGRRLVVELWQPLREQRSFASEQELVDQIARDVDETRAATNPVTGA